MKIIEIILNVWMVITTPECWIQGSLYSVEWDKELIRLISDGQFTDIDNYTAKIGGHLVWVSNHPYGSFTLTPIGVRPRRSTILRAYDKLVRDQIANDANSNK